MYLYESKPPYPVFCSQGEDSEKLAEIAGQPVKVRPLQQEHTQLFDILMANGFHHYDCEESLLFKGPASCFY